MCRSAKRWVQVFVFLVRLSIGALMLMAWVGCEDPNGRQGATNEVPTSQARRIDPSSQVGESSPIENDYSKDYWEERKAQLRFLRAPKLRELDVPDSYGNTAIWGATGRDSNGRMYFGVASENVEDPSAKLLRYDPSKGAFEMVGWVNEKLEELGIRKEFPFPETQMKIHSKIVQAGDGKLYFSSQDEHEEAGDGTRSALFGGRLFSLDPVTDQWECVHQTPEGLIAVAGRGRYVVTQGYFGHVLYQYDTQTKAIRRVALGTYKGHVSRNIFMDRRGHVYGIRAGLANDQQLEGVYKVGQDRVRVSLVELGTEFEQVHEWPLSDYSPSWSTDSHGITGYCEFNNGNIVFVTHTGALWQISFASGSAELERLGWIHPRGSAYCASLFAPYGDRYVGGVVSSKEGYQWALFDILTKRSVILKLDPASRKLLETPKLLIYGCETLDERGCGYLVGWKAIPRGFGPHVIEVRWE
jgi:hypothetical protein